MADVATLDPEPLAVQTIAGKLTAISNPYRAPRRLDAVDLAGPAGSSAVVIVAPTTNPDPTYIVTRTNKGDANTYDAAPRIILIPQSWRVIVQWTGGTGTVASAKLYATEVDGD